MMSKWENFVLFYKNVMLESRHITTVEVLLQKLNNFWKTGRLKLVVKNLIITEYQLFSRNMNFCIIYNLIINIEMK